MRTIDTEKSSRIWTVADIPKLDKTSLEELEVNVSYNGDSNGLTAEALDTFVVPLFKLAPKLLEICVRRPWREVRDQMSYDEFATYELLAELPRYMHVTYGPTGSVEGLHAPYFDLADVLMRRGVSKGDQIVKILRNNTQVLATSDGSNWIPEPTEEDGDNS